MNALAAFLANPLLWKIVISYWLFSSFVQALPDLKATSPTWYGIFYRFLHLFAGNLKNAAVKFDVPGANQ